MQLIYRGNTYSYNPTKMNVSSQANGKYRGITYQIQQTIAPAQPRPALKYRGSYCTGINRPESRARQEAIA